MLTTARETDELDIHLLTDFAKFRLQNRISIVFSTNYSSDPEARKKVMAALMTVRLIQYVAWATRGLIHSLSQQVGIGEHHIIGETTAPCDWRITRNAVDRAELNKHGLERENAIM